MVSISNHTSAVRFEVYIDQVRDLYTQTEEDSWQPNDVELTVKAIDRTLHTFKYRKLRDCDI